MQHTLRVHYKDQPVTPISGSHEMHKHYVEKYRISPRFRKWHVQLTQRRQREYYRCMPLKIYT